MPTRHHRGEHEKAGKADAKFDAFRQDIWRLAVKYKIVETPHYLQNLILENEMLKAQNEEMSKKLERLRKIVHDL